MQSRGTSDWLRGRSMSWVDWVVALASSQMADERQSAVLGQVSSATLSLMIGLTYAAGLAFTLIDYRRLEPCVWVFLAIALGAQAFTRAAAGRGLPYQDQGGELGWDRFLVNRLRYYLRRAEAVRSGPSPSFRDKLILVC